MRKKEDSLAWTLFFLTFRGATPRLLLSPPPVCFATLATYAIISKRAASGSFFIRVTPSNRPTYPPTQFWGNIVFLNHCESLFLTFSSIGVKTNCNMKNGNAPVPFNSLRFVGPHIFATHFCSALHKAIAKINCLWLTSPPTHSLTLPPTHWRNTCIRSYNKNIYMVYRPTRVHREPQVVPHQTTPKHQLCSY